MKKTIYITALILGLSFIVVGCSQHQDSVSQVNNKAENKTATEVTSQEVAIKKLFVDKYNKPVDEITIEIEQGIDDYARGMVIYAPGGPENIKMFFVFKDGDNWQLAYEGVGSIFCDQADLYNFPQDMVDDCQSADETPQNDQSVSE